MPEPAKKYEHAEVPIAFLNEVDGAFFDLEETIAVIDHLLDLHQGLAEDIGPVPPKVAGSIGYLLSRAQQRFRRELDGWFQARREALGTPVWDPSA